MVGHDAIFAPVPRPSGITLILHVGQCSAEPPRVMVVGLDITKRNALDPLDDLSLPDHAPLPFLAGFMAGLFCCASASICAAMRSASMSAAAAASASNCAI